MLVSCWFCNALVRNQKISSTITSKLRHHLKGTLKKGHRNHGVTMTYIGIKTAFVYIHVCRVQKTTLFHFID